MGSSDELHWNEIVLLCVARDWVPGQVRASIRGRSNQNAHTWLDRQVR